MNAFNAAILDLANQNSQEVYQAQTPSNTTICAVCSEDLSKGNSRATPCINEGCSAQMRSKCFRKHRCPLLAGNKTALPNSKKRPIGMTSFLLSENEKCSTDLTISKSSPTVTPPRPQVQSTSTTMSNSEPLSSLSTQLVK